MQTLSKKWYIAYTRPKWEKRVTDLLAKKKIEYYCPLNKTQKPWSDLKKVVIEPLFASYVFVHLHESQLMQVCNSTDGIVSLVHWMGRPAEVHAEDIEALKKFLGDFSEVSLEKTRVTPGEYARLFGGPLMMREGNVIEIRTSTVKLALPSLGYTLVAEVKRDHAEITGRLTKLETIVK